MADARRRLETLVDQMRVASGDVASELEETARAHELFASLYVQLERLHRSLKLPDVVAAIHEALINLVGSEDFALFVRDDGSGRFQPLSALGAGQSLGAFAVGEGALGGAVAAGAVAFGDPLATVPLVDDDGQCVGVLAIVGLLRHKPAIERRDRMLLEVLSMHAGVALKAALCAAAASPSWDIERLRALLGGVQ